MKGEVSQSSSGPREFLRGQGNGSAEICGTPEPQVVTSVSVNSKSRLTEQQQHAPAAALASERQIVTPAPPVTVVSDKRGHLDSRTAAREDLGARRTGPGPVDQGRTDVTPGGVVREECFQPGATENGRAYRVPATGTGPQCRIPTQERSGEVLHHQAAHQCEREHDHECHEATGDAAHLPVESPRPDRHSGLRQARLVELRGDQGASAILCQVGGGNGSREWRGRPSLATPGGMAREQPEPCGSCERGDGSASRASTRSPDVHPGDDDAQGQEVEQGFLEQCHQCQRHRNDDQQQERCTGPCGGPASRGDCGLEEGPRAPAQEGTDRARHGDERGIVCDGSFGQGRVEDARAQGLEEFFGEAEVASSRPLSASQRLSQELSRTKARQLEDTAWSVVPQLFEGLVTQDRPSVLELTEAPESALTREVQTLTGRVESASRCAAWNGCQLATGDGVRLMIDRLRYEQPRHVWIALSSSAFSPCQNWNQQTREQQESLAQQRRQEHKRYIGASCVVHTCVQLGIHVSWIWPAQCQAWRLPLMQKLQQKYHMHQGMTKACSLGLRHPGSQQFMSQGWKVISTCQRVAQVLDKPCRCPRSYKHGRSEGLRDEKQDVYPEALAKLVAPVITQELNHASVMSECGQESLLPPEFGAGEHCTCRDVGFLDSGLKCGSCLGSRVISKVEEDRSEVQGIGSEADDALDEALWTEHACAEAEVKASQAQRAKQYDHHTCEAILALVPLKAVLKHRKMLGPQPARYLTLGLYSHGNHYGVTRASKSLPNVCQYLNSWLRYHTKDIQENTSIVVSVNNQLPLHKDNHNLPGTQNHCIGIGNYSKGGLWLEHKLPPTESSGSHKVLPNGTRISGRVHPTRHRVVTFNGTSWHETEAWEGNRVLVTTYCSRGCQKVGSGLIQELRKLGFQPPKSTEARKEEDAYMLRGTEGSSHDSGVSGVSGSESSKRKERIKRQLYLLHSATGHGSKKVLLDALKRRNAPEEVLSLAREFRCSVCEEKQHIGPRHLASLEVLPPKWHAISVDVGHWRHPHSGEHVQFLMIIDQGSRFRQARVLTKGSKQQPSAPVCLQYLNEGWNQIFGKPRAMRLDAAGSFRSQAVVEYCDRHGILLDLIPADAHWATGICEQAVQGTKVLMSKLSEEDPDISSEEALSLSIRTFNEREQIRGFSPIQHAFGRSPDATGRLGGGPQELPDELLVESATADFERTVARRATAEKALADWQAAQRLSRANNSRSRPIPDFEPGELVYFWRTQDASQGRVSPGSKRGRFLGPARVLALERKPGEDGVSRAGNAIWLVRGRNLIKCSPEQLRRASPREELLEGLTSQHGESPTPWTYSRLASELGGSQYEDISMEVPEEEEWHRAQDEREEETPPRFRLRTKRPAPTSVNEEPEDLHTGSSQASRNARNRPRQGPLLSEQAHSAWWHEVKEQAWPQSCQYWQAANAAVAVEVPMPDSRRGTAQALENLSCYVSGSLKRRAIEVSEKRLTDAEKEEFQQAKAVEVKNFIAAQAFEALPDEMKPSKEQAISMRWILTWKLRDDGSTKAKARAVLLGYQDPAYEHRSTTAPVMTRQTRQLMLQVSANKSWRVYKGDVSGAFLQGRTYPDKLYCIPCKEICDAMGIAEGSITRVRRACYGLVDAPLEWYRTVSEFLESVGLQRLWSDACAWVWRPNGVLRGMVAGHVDDFLFGGREDDEGWQSILRQIKEKFKWSDWEHGRFVQCGVEVVQDSEGFTLSQARYVGQLREIGVSQTRRKDLNAPTTEHERSQLRALLGALSWHAQQVAPHVSSAVGILLSEVNNSSVRTIISANTLLDSVRVRKDHCLRIHKFPEHEELGVFGWVDAASQNRPDGGSTQGLVIGLAPVSLMRGELTKVSIAGWSSHRIDRTCRSPGAAETLAAVNGEDSVYYMRYQWSEIIHNVADARDPEGCARKVLGCLVSDSRNVYDKLQTEVLSIKGAEKRSNLELLSLKEAMQRTQLQIRWVHSEAQLSNPLTKLGNQKELELFYRMGCVWRIVEDPQMRSARRRRVDGLDPLEAKQQHLQQPEQKQQDLDFE